MERRLQILQNRAARVILRRDPRANVEELHQTLQWEYLQDRRTQHLCIMYLRRVTCAGPYIPVHTTNYQVSGRVRRNHRPAHAVADISCTHPDTPGHAKFHGTCTEDSTIDDTTTICHHPYAPERLPKIHKKGNPGRPILSANDCASERISELADFHLRPLVTRLPSYIKDTTDFLRRLNKLGKVPQNAILVTWISLPCIPTYPQTKGYKRAGKHCRKIQQTYPRKLSANYWTGY
ncbi:hypothetical protein Bbelb_071250 [Branchiostoma belcheri]|nr:hypothetical protein Bbelb_071250 [Branchiostoma belcheri]